MPADKNQLVAIPLNYIDCGIDFGIVLLYGSTEVSSLMGHQRPAVLAQIQRVEGNTKAGIEISYMFLKEVIVVAVHIQHSPTPF